jgi:CHAT domain-containing protein
VLSACETSRPGTALPDEVVALSTGLLQAGVAGVIASLWIVPDFDTALLMACFYAGEFRASPAAALQHAQQWMRDNDDAARLAELERSLAGAASWIAPELAEPFADALRSHKRSGPARLQSWAGFVYVGA